MVAPARVFTGAWMNPSLVAAPAPAVATNWTEGSPENTALTSFEPAEAPRVHWVWANPVALVVEVTGLTDPAPVPTTQVIAFPPTPLPLSSSSRTTSESASGAPTEPLCASPETRISAVGFAAIAVWVKVTVGSPADDRFGGLRARGGPEDPLGGGQAVGAGHDGGRADRAAAHGGPLDLDTRDRVAEGVCHPDHQRVRQRRSDRRGLVVAARDLEHRPAAGDGRRAELDQQRGGDVASTHLGLDPLLSGGTAERPARRGLPIGAGLYARGGHLAAARVDGELHRTAFHGPTQRVGHLDHQRLAQRRPRGTGLGVTAHDDDPCRLALVGQHDVAAARGNGGCHPERDQGRDTSPGRSHRLSG
jgi:hypothetical protein